MGHGALGIGHGNDNVVGSYTNLKKEHDRWRNCSVKDFQLLIWFGEKVKG
ncbi:hypothetical protein FDUTEX481_05638 [Tolypothrix sp. PCC 7601]|nr:hypothetical protein FDUTEX481_05638 [Tolypothrix sp. PCC 7601]